MNFSFLHPHPQFAALYRNCTEAEQTALVSPNASAVAARRGMEFVVRFIFQALVEDGAPRTVFEMAEEPAFKDYVNDPVFLSSLHYVRRMGNVAAHEGGLSRAEALQVLEQLHFLVGEFCILIGLVQDYAAYQTPAAAAPASAPLPQVPPVSGAVPRPQPASQAPVSPGLPAQPPQAPAATPAPPAAQIPAVTPVPPAAQAAPSPQLVAQYAKRLRHTRFNVRHGRDETENKRLFLTACLREAGWPLVNKENQALPRSAGVRMLLENGETADYVLYGQDMRPLAVIEFSTTNKNLLAGRARAIAQGDLLAAGLGQPPIVYYTNGYHIFVIDQLGYPPRRVFQFHSLEELELLKLRKGLLQDISSPVIDDAITNREYQKQAIRKTCAAFMSKRRHALLVMATGTGKTRVSISCVDVLLKAGWIKNVLFLADRTSLVRQAHKNFTKLLPSVTTTVYAGGSLNRDPHARIMFSTYQTMINLISDEGREFGIGRFDLIIIDEAHRSIFKRYGALFGYFDALMLGLTATPRVEDNKSTYEVFRLPSGQPDYAYELEEAIADGFLVGFSVLDKTTQKIRDGIAYDDLSDAEKQRIEDGFASGDEENLRPIDLSGSMLSHSKMARWIINLGTIDAMLNDLMKNGLKIEGGDKLGKTIIFSRSHQEAEQITLRFQHLYPHLGLDFCKLIDSQVPNSLQLIDSLGERDSLPQVAVSVDMLDTGIDIPDVLNLVFFKEVFSKIKFLQMIGRGTRLSPSIFGPGQDKQGFLIFDYYDNFNYFATKNTWAVTKAGTEEWSMQISSQSWRINLCRLSILRWLTEMGPATAFEASYLLELRQHFVGETRSLCNDDIEVQQKMAYVSKYRTEENWYSFTDEKEAEIIQHILPLFKPDPAPPKVKSFDLLIYTLMRDYPQKLEEGEDIGRIRFGFLYIRNAFSERMRALLKLKTIPEVVNKEKLILAMMEGNYLLDHFSYENCEKVRLELRDLMRYLPDDMEYYIVDVADYVMDSDGSSQVQKEKPYAEKAQDYLKDSKNPALAKLRNLDELSQEEKKDLNDAFTLRLGTAADYAAWSNNVPLLVFLRSQVGISDQAVQTKLGSFLNSSTLDPAQLNYLTQIISYARSNGDITLPDLQRVSPFCDVDVVQLFGSKLAYIKILVDGLHKPVMWES